jgi:predicted MFS family arabinose efflux permease
VETKLDLVTVIEQHERQATFRDVFSVPAFRVLFASRSLAIAADTLRIIALSMLVFALTNSTLLSAVTFGIGFLPQVIGGVLFGSLSDRLRPRALITAGYVVECVAAVALATLPLPVGASLAIVAVVGALTPIFGGASSRLIAEVLTGDAYVLGRSVSSMSAGGAQLLGMAFGGLAVAALGPQHALLVRAACHAVSALTVRFGLSDLDPPSTDDTQSAVRQSWRTNTELMRDATIRSLLLIQWLPPTFVVGAEALIVAYAEVRGFSEGSAGLLLACAPAGMLLGHLVVGRFVRPHTRTRLIAPLILLLGVPVLLLALDPPAWIAGGLLLLTGAGFAYPLGIQREFVDAVPESSRGQAFGLLSMGLMTMQGIGPLIFGALAQAAGISLAQAGGIRLALICSGLACVSTAAIWWRRAR